MYRHFGRALNGRVETAMQAALTIRPRGGHSENYYRLEDYGLDSARERRRFAHYITHFRIDRERDVASDDSKSPQIAV